MTAREIHGYIFSRVHISFTHCKRTKCRTDLKLSGNVLHMVHNILRHVLPGEREEGERKPRRACHRYGNELPPPR